MPSSVSRAVSLDVIAAATMSRGCCKGSQVLVSNASLCALHHDGIIDFFALDRCDLVATHANVLMLPLGTLAIAQGGVL